MGSGWPSALGEARDHVGDERQVVPKSDRQRIAPSRVGSGALAVVADAGDEWRGAPAGAEAPVVVDDAQRAEAAEVEERPELDDLGDGEERDPDDVVGDADASGRPGSAAHRGETR